MGKKKVKAKRQTKAQIWRSLEKRWQAAFKRSVRTKWMKIVRKRGDIPCELACSLCTEANSRGSGGISCVKLGCPIALFVGRSSCYGTPYWRWHHAHCAGKPKKMSEEAIAELQFLIGFLPKADELRKKAEALIKKKAPKDA